MILYNKQVTITMDDDKIFYDILSILVSNIFMLEYLS